MADRDAAIRRTAADTAVPSDTLNTADTPDTADTLYTANSPDAAGTAVTADTPVAADTAATADAAEYGTVSRGRLRRIRRGRRRYGTSPEEACPVCGLEAPSYRVETPDHRPLGCERCLLVYREGRMQL